MNDAKTPPSASALRVHDYLAEQGYRPHFDDDGDIVFRVEGMSWVVLFTADDAHFYRVCVPNFWSIDDEDEAHAAEVAADYVNARVKSAKVFRVKSDTWAALEGFYQEPEHFIAILPRAIGSVKACVVEFLKLMHDDDDEPRGPAN
jgi:hypothetical protein